MIAATPVTFSRSWAMPSADTFTIAPIAALLDRWLEGRDVVIDPFARNAKRGTITNDLNPQTDAQYHLPAEVFAADLAARGVVADAVLFDPPYSPRQIAEVYQQIGKPCTTSDTQNARLYSLVRRHLAPCVRPGGIAISFGWNSSGFGKKLGFEQREILLVCHGAAHSDSIVVVEEKTEVSLW